MKTGCASRWRSASRMRASDTPAWRRASTAAAIDSWRGRRPLALGQGADAVVLLGQVDQVEVDAEGAHQLQEPLGGLAGRPRQQRRLDGGRVGRGRAQGDGGAARVLHRLEDLRPTLLAQHLAHDVAEQADIVAQAIGRLGPGRGGPARPAPVMA